MSGSSKIVGPVLGGMGTVGGLALSAMGMPEVGIPLAMAGAGSGIGGAMGGYKGMMEGGMAGGGVGAGLEGAGAGGMGIGGLASKLGLGTPSGTQLASALANNPAMKGITPDMVQSFGPAMAPQGYNPQQATGALQALGGGASAGLSPVVASMGQQQPAQAPQRPQQQQVPVQASSTGTPQLPQYQAPQQGGPLAQYLQFLKGAA